MNAVSLQEIHN